MDKVELRDSAPLFDQKVPSCACPVGIVVRDPRFRAMGTTNHCTLTCPSSCDKLNLMNEITHQLDRARQAANRLERLNVDSAWARRACGLRGSLLHNLALIERSGSSPRRLAHLERLLQKSHIILTKAAREIPEYREPTPKSYERSH